MRRIGKTDISRVKHTAAYEWALAVATGKTPHRQGELAKYAADRFLNDLKRDDIMFDLSEYERLLRYYKMFRHTKGLLVGKPFEPRPDQAFYLGQVVSWKYRQTGEPRIRETYKEVARKNGKSWETGGLAGYFLTARNESEAEVYSLATSEKQARESWKAFKSMSKTTQKYHKFLEYRENVIRHPKSNSFFEPVPSTGEMLDGKNPTFIIADEYHLFKPKDDLSLSSLKGGSGARAYSLTMKITTAGTNVFGSCYDERKTAINVLKGLSKLDHYLPLIFALDEGDDWQDERNWYKANPALGISKSLGDVRQLFENALAMPRLLNTFKSKQLDIWTNAVSNWLKLEDWRKLARPLAYDALKGKHCYIGADLSDTSDLTALMLLFPPQEGLPKFYAYPIFFVPQAASVVKELQDKVPYSVWQQQGWVNLEEGRINKRKILNIILSVLMRDFTLIAFAYDPYHATDIAEGLQEAGVKTLAVRQGFPTLSPACKTLEDWIALSEIEHNGNPCLDWNISNAVVRRDANNNIAPDKSKSTNRIDGLAALLDAIVAATNNDLKPKIIKTCPVILM